MEDRERNNLLVGQIALERNLITAEQLRECLKERSEDERPRPIGVLFVAKRFLTDEQLLAVLEEQTRRLREPAEYADVAKGDILFGSLLVKRGSVTRERLNEALRLQQELAERGTPRRLGEILVEQGVLSPEAVRETLKLQGKVPMHCPRCGARFNIIGYAGGRNYECRKCKARLEVTTDSVAVDGTVIRKRGAAKGPARQFGKFSLLEELGTGGFGAVYKAYQKDLGRHVALKILHSGDSETVDRFVREAHTLARLSHPHIVSIYEVGTHEGQHYIAMQYLEGLVLSRLRLDVRAAAEVIYDVAGAVHYAHEKGVVHRDIKPANLIMGENGHTWLTDFGLARQVGDPTKITMAGNVVGTPAYMPPEQADGKPFTPRGDVYSLGATLYELLAGRSPFDGATPLDVLDRVRRGDPAPLRRQRPTISPDLEIIVAKAMEKDPMRRYASARELTQDLRRHLDGEPILARRASPLRTLAWQVRRNLAVVALTTLLIVGVAASSIWVGGRKWTRDARRRQSVTQILQAMDRSDWAAALTHAEEGLRSAPGDAEILELRRRARVEHLIATARGTLARTQDLRADCLRLEAEIPAFHAFPTVETPWEREKLKLLEAESLAECFARQALELDAANPRARRVLSDLWQARSIEARSKNRGLEAKVYAHQAVLYGVDEYQEDSAN